MVPQVADIGMSTKRFSEVLTIAVRISYQPELAFWDPNQTIVVYLSIDCHLNVIALVVCGNECSDQ